LQALRTNPLECWTKAHFEEPIVFGGFPFMRYAVVSDPAAIRKILIEDQSAYRKSTIERRVLGSRMPNGLVTVNGKQWERLRRTLAPLFGRTMTAGFARRWRASPPTWSSAGRTSATAPSWRSRPK
jgi:cytochrome P450